MSTATDQLRRHLPSREEWREFRTDWKREARPHVPLELDPRSPLYRRSEMRSAIIAVGAVVATLLVGLVVGLVALFG